MPIISIEPKTVEVREFLNAYMLTLRSALKSAVSTMAKNAGLEGFPESDIIVNLLECPFANVDPAAADYVVHVDTCQHPGLESNGNYLCTTVAGVFISAGLADVLRAEIWPKFLQGPWCLIVEGRIVDRVPHPRSET